MADKIFNLIIRMTKMGGADAETIKSLTDIKTAMTTGAAVAGIFTAAYYGINKVIDATVGDFSALATEVEKFKLQTGMSAEDSSRLVKVMKDLEISASDVETAFKFAEKNGFAPNIQSVLALRDQYMALNPGMERTQFLLKEFGKSGINLQKFFETGDIVERLNAVNQAMILSDKSIQSVQSYKDALVGLNDSLEGIKLGTGNFLIQPLTAYIDLWLAIPGIVEHGAKAITLSLGGKFEAAHKEMNAMGEDIAPFMIAFEKMFGVEGPEALNRSEDSLMAARNAAFNYSAAIADNTAQQEKNNEISKTFQDLLKGTTPTLEEMAVQAYQTALATDGLFSPEDAAAVVGYQLELGLVTEKEAEAMLAAINLQNVLNAMKDMHVTLTIDEIHNMLAGMDNLSAGGLTPEQYASYIARGLQIPSKGDTSGAGTNGRYTVKANDGTLWYVDDNGWSTTGYKAEGGALGKADIVGEQGWEAVIQGQDGRHVVIPHDMSRWLAAQGLIGAGAGMAGGGVFGGQSGSHTGWASKPFGGVSVPDISTMEAVAPLVDSAAQSSQAANPESTRQIIQQTQIAIAGNDKLLGAVRSMQNAIEGLPEQLAAEIQKRR